MLPTHTGCALPPLRRISRRRRCLGVLVMTPLTVTVRRHARGGRRPLRFHAAGTALGARLWRRLAFSRTSLGRTGRRRLLLLLLLILWRLGAAAAVTAVPSASASASMILPR